MSAVRHLVDTRDPDQARDLVASSYCDHRLTITADAAAFRATQTEVAVDRVAVHRLRYGAAVRVEPVPLASWVLVTTPVRGRVRITSEGRSRDLATGESVAIDPERGFDLTWSSGAELRTVRLPRALVERAALAVGWQPGHGLRFDLAAAARPHDRAWDALVSYVESEARQAGSAVAAPLVARQLARAMAAAVVTGHPLVDVRDESATVPHPRAVRRAIEHLEQHAAHDLDLAGLADAAGLSVRGLQAAFRRHLGASPSAVLRDLRLDRVRADLVRSDPQRTSVADVAHAWGFGNLGRFARAYTERFDELPSRTLRR